MPHSGFRLFVYCCIAVLFAGLITLPVHAQDNTLWPGFRHDNQRTGRSPLAGPSFPDALWQSDLRGFAYASPAFGPGGVIYAASESRLYAYNRGGDLRWTFDFPDIVPASVNIRGVVSSPAVTPEGIVYIGSLDEKLYSLTANGSLRWAHDTGGQIFSSPVVDAAGRVYVGSRSGDVVAVNANGTLAWTFPTTGEVFASPALDTDGSLYVGSTDGGLYAINSANGTSKWTPFTVGSEFVSSPAIAPNGTVYAGSLNDILYAVNGDTGRPIWTYNTGGDIVSSPAIGADGTVYVATIDGFLHAVNPANGQARWNQPYNAQDSIASSPAIGQDGLIYFGVLDGTMHALEDSGEMPIPRWTYNAGSPVWSSPAIGTDETLYFVSAGLNSDRGLLHAIGPAAFDVRFQGTPTDGDDALLTINQAGTATAAAGTLFYRRAGDIGFESLEFAGQATIPGAAVTESGLEYYIIGAVPGPPYPANTPSQRPAVQPVRVASAGPPYALTPRSYKMITVPLLLDDTTIEDVLVDDYEPYDPLVWRLLRWKGDDFVEYPTLNDAVRPGEAFFLVTRDGTSFDATDGFSVSTSLPYPIALQPGWNMIGNPFAFPVAWSNVDRDASVVNAIAYFDGVEMVQDPGAIDVLAPWEGYFVFNDSDAAVTIAIPPIPAPQSDGELEEEVLFARISATVPGNPGVDSQNWIGTGAAPFTRPEAPAVDTAVRLSLIEDNQPMAVSVRPAGGTLSWPLRLEGSGSENAVLRFDGLVDAFPGQDIYLIDEDFGYAQAVSGDAIPVALSAAYPERRLRLTVGSAVPDGIPVAPTQTALLPNYPNPFSTATTVAYTLAEPAEVTLTIYNSLGQAVETLVRGWQTPGRYAVDWTSAGKAASGIYHYRLTAGTFSSSGSMILVR